MTIPQNTQADDPEVVRERAIHDVNEAVERVWELLAPETADWVVLWANIQADRKFRARRAQS